VQHVPQQQANELRDGALFAVSAHSDTRLKQCCRQAADLHAGPSEGGASTTGRIFVVRIRNGRTEWVDVKTGLTSGPFVEVFGDLRPGDEIAVRGTDEIRAGTEVRVMEAKPGPS
jgi:hypothetical protein